LDGMNFQASGLPGAAGTARILQMQILAQDASNVRAIEFFNQLREIPAGTPCSVEVSPSW